MSDEELINGCCHGDRKIQKALFEHFSGRMLAVCMRYAKERQEAEDILQESFIKVFEHIKNFKKESPLVIWIKRIVINTALNHKRNKLYLYPMVDIEDMQQQLGQELTLSDYHFQDLLKMIQSLPEGCQVIFNLFAIEGYSHKEIAQLTGISEGTSKSQYARARNLLQNMLCNKVSKRYEANLRKL